MTSDWLQEGLNRFGGLLSFGLHIKAASVTMNRD